MDSMLSRSLNPELSGTVMATYCTKYWKCVGKANSMCLDWRFDLKRINTVRPRKKALMQ